jgi:hypothetical protein
MMKYSVSSFVDKKLHPCEIKCLCLICCPIFQEAPEKYEFNSELQNSENYAYNLLANTDSITYNDRLAMNENRHSFSLTKLGLFNVLNYS